MRLLPPIVSLLACQAPDRVPATVTSVELTCEAGPGDRYNTAIIETEPVSWSWTWGGGVTVVDLDGDDALDLVLPVESGLEVRWGPRAWRAEPEPLSAVDLSYASGTSAADFDGDGDLDLYVMRVRGFPVPDGGSDAGVNRLLRNDGDRRFVDVTAEAGVDGCGPHHREGTTGCYRTMTASWADVDGDDDLDLFVGNYGFVDDTPGTRQVDMEPGEPSFLYLNEGDGSFAEAPLPDAVSDGYTFAGGFADLDADGAPDLVVVNDFGVLWPNRVLFGGDGALVLDEANASGLTQSMTGMGLGLGDLNGDGWLDLAIPNWQDHALFESRPDTGTWVETSAARGLVNARRRNQLVGWGTTLGDLDNDTDLDAITQFGFVRNDNPVWANPAKQGDAVYLNDAAERSDGAYSFEDVGYDRGLASPGMGRGAALADLNRDGWLDLVKRELQGQTRVHLSRCGRATGTLLRLRQPGANRFAVGARVVAKADGRVLRRDVSAGGRGFASMEPLEVHLGTGSARRIDRLEVVWPDGARTVVRGVPTNHAVTVVRDR